MVSQVVVDKNEQKNHYLFTQLVLAMMFLKVHRESCDYDWPRYTAFFLFHVLVHLF